MQYGDALHTLKSTVTVYRGHPQFWCFPRWKKCALHTSLYGNFGAQLFRKKIIFQNINSKFFILFMISKKMLRSCLYTEKMGRQVNRAVPSTASSTVLNVTFFMFFLLFLPLASVPLRDIMFWPWCPTNWPWCPLNFCIIEGQTGLALNIAKFKAC